MRRSEAAKRLASAREAADCRRILVKIEVGTKDGTRTYYYVCRNVIHAMRAATKTEGEIRRFSVENLGEVLFTEGGNGDV